MVYVVVQDGIYRHAIGGVRSKLGEAKALARRCIEKEPDEHHAWEVIPVRSEPEFIGLPPGVKYAGAHSDPTPIVELKPVYRLERGGEGGKQVTVTIDTEPGE